MNNNEKINNKCSVLESVKGIKDEIDYIAGLVDDGTIKSNHPLTINLTRLFFFADKIEQIYKN